MNLDEKTNHQQVQSIYCHNKAGLETVVGVSAGRLPDSDTPVLTIYVTQPPDLRQKTIDSNDERLVTNSEELASLLRSHAELIVERVERMPPDYLESFLGRFGLTEEEKRQHEYNANFYRAVMQLYTFCNYVNTNALDMVDRVVAMKELPIEEQRKNVDRFRRMLRDVFDSIEESLPQDDHSSCFTHPPQKQYPLICKD